ncbi:DapH/DapD/GlmU-related protein [Hungatella hathewayi]|uniref:Acetyltransferase n=1 Tax=Hungatella hathewayi WAL-18680 TaxID=742737 RepID=G5IB16_9FIRM|nr:DapH/DapD/GlmU-related protein [Hungatella hathewayi]EHI61331.1 hypothetical protein HMPREF9473_00693 [ [Hungatella hathewayi WAL-18680]
MNNHYSFSELLSTGYAFFMTKIFYPKARLIRRPVYIRGAKSMTFEEGLTLGHSCRFDLLGTKKTLQIGRNCELGDNVHIVAHENVIIGSNVLIASKVFISDTDHGRYKGSEQSAPNIPPNKRSLYTKPVSIGNNVWIGENSVILSGSVIGNGCIIGANTVVKGEFPNNVMIVGSPAKSIKVWNEKSCSWQQVN